MRVIPAVCGFILVACGSDDANRTSALVGGAGSCGAIAEEYSAARVDAASCDPADAASCSVQYPLAVKEGSDPETAVFTGLCWVGCMGHVNPARTATLDAVLRQYERAGCVVGYCPSPPQCDTTCRANASGRYACGIGP